MLIRRLLPADVPAYRALMLEAYARHPEAFMSSAAERAALPLAWWEARVKEDPDANEMVFGAFDGVSLLGVAGLSFETREKARHKATLFGMYVRPEGRKSGTGRALVHAVLTQARRRPGVRLLQLTVTHGNAAAERLYEHCGFVPFGLEPNALMLPGGFHAKLHMWCDLGEGE
jgi:RimJ/RimL family protein N-acetyltransferase